jgi:phage tail-like protein
VVTYREGNEPPTPRKLWGLNQYEPLVLESGVTDDSIALYEWRKQVEAGQLDEVRGNAAVVVLDEEGEQGPRWELKRAWPVRYEAPKLAARGKDVAIERLEIAHEGMERTA